MIAYVDGECRGLAASEYVPFTDSYVFHIMAFSNKAEEKKKPWEEV